MATNDFKLKQVYSFDVWPVAILGNDFKNVTILGIIDQETANQSIDTYASHVNMYPYLPAGTPNSPDGYNYIKIKTASGVVTILGLAWIKADTILQVQSTSITVTISDVSPDDAPRIVSALAQNGFNKIETVVN